MFDDRRGRRLVVLAHCILNQNAKLDRCAHCAGAVREVVEVLMDWGVGIIQMECPEMLHLGLDRQTDPAANPSVAAEDTRIAARMEEDTAQAIVERIAQNVVAQIADYRRHGFSVIGLLGINGSPSCGVETTWRDDHEPAGYGQLVAALARQLEAQGLSIPMRGIRSRDAESAWAITHELIQQAARTG